MANVKASEALSALRKSYNSIDVRAAAVKLYGWTAVVSTVYFSSLSRNAIRRRHSRLSTSGRLFPKVGLQSFLKSLPTERSGELAREFKRGILHFDSDRVRLSSGIDIMNLNVFNVPDYQPSPITRHPDWPLLQAVADRKVKDENLWNEFESHEGEARLLGYEAVDEMANDFLQTTVVNRNTTTEVMLALPIYAKLLATRASKQDVLVTTRSLRTVGNLQINAKSQRLDSQGRYYLPPIVKTCDIKLQSSLKPSIREEETAIRFNDLQPLDRVSVTLIHKLIPSLLIGQLNSIVPFERPLEPLANRCNHAQMPYRSSHSRSKRQPSPQGGMSLS